jgi:hypothetical protein
MGLASITITSYTFSAGLTAHGPSLDRARPPHIVKTDN